MKRLIAVDERYNRQVQEEYIMDELDKLGDKYDEQLVVEQKYLEYLDEERTKYFNQWKSQLHKYRIDELRQIRNYNDYYFLWCDCIDEVTYQNYNQHLHTIQEFVDCSRTDDWVIKYDNKYHYGIDQRDYVYWIKKQDIEELKKHLAQI